MRNLHCLLVSILLLISQELFAQFTEVTGKVLDPSGAPIPNTNGIFKLHVPPGAIALASGSKSLSEVERVEVIVGAAFSSFSSHSYII